MLDVFNTDAFDTVSLTEAINVLPIQPSRLEQLGVFEDKGIATTTALVENKNGVLGLIPTAARGTNPNTVPRGSRQVRSFNVPHIPLTDTILAADVQDVRAFGSEDELEGVNEVVNDRLSELKASLDVTAEFHRAGAITGVILDADGTSVIYNLYDEFGISEASQQYTMASAGNPLSKTLAAKRSIEVALGNLVHNGFHAICSPGWFEAFVKSADVKEAYARWQDGQFLRDDNRKGFSIWGVTFEEYSAQVADVPFIPANTARLFPVGVRGLFKRINAPADYMETANTIGKPYYAKQEPMPMNKGITLEAQINPLMICTRPKALVKLYL